MNSNFGHSMKTGLVRFASTVALLASLAVGGVATAAESSYPLDHFPEAKLNNLPSLQRGAKLFVNYCLGCHSASVVRYNTMNQIGLTDDQIKANLMFTAENVGDTMRIPMRKQDAAAWFGAAPPDLSLTARSRSSKAGPGHDWLYTFLRSFYRDANRPTGWNNALFPNVGMPHVLWELQGVRGATIEQIKPAEGLAHGEAGGVRKLTTFDALGQVTETSEPLAQVVHHDSTTVRFGTPAGGALNNIEYDDAVADLVAFMTFIADPTAAKRERMGVWVLGFIAIFFVVSLWLNRAFWKDVK